MTAGNGLRNFEQIPAQLIYGKRLVAWGLETRDGKPTKVPRVPHRPHVRASVADVETWGTYEDAIAAVRDGKADGIGRVLAGDGYTVLDLDGCRDPGTGVIRPEAMVIVQRLNSYTEVSPSGRGLHVWCKGSLPPGRRRSGPIELYDRGRYMTLTGHHVAGTPTEPEERTEQLKYLHASVFRTASRVASDSELDDAVLILTASTSTNRDPFSRLWRGDIESYRKDHSAADFALCKELAHRTEGDAARIDRLFRQSGLMRAKWDEPRGDQTYGQLTVTSATELTDPGRGPIPFKGRTPEASRPVLVRLADVEPEAIDWLWPDRIALGKTTLLCGDPGLGKSWVTLDIAARASSGRAWPDGSPASAARNVLLLSAEDGLADTIRPRLDALGADVSRISHWSVVRGPNNTERGVQLSDVAALAAAIDESRAEIVIIDPVTAYLGGIDAHRDSEVRGLLAPIMRIAEEKRVAVIVVMHLAKNTQRPAIHRPGGSIGFTAFSRVVLAVAPHPSDDRRRVLLPVKSNISVPSPALTFSLAEGRLQWDPEPLIDFDVDTLLSGLPGRRHQRKAADEWLRGALANGPVESNLLKSEGMQAGFSWRTINRAKDRLGIRADRVGFGENGKWFWELPAANDANERDDRDTLAFNEPESEFTRGIAVVNAKECH